VWPSLVAATVLGSLPAWPFAHAQVGSVIENVELATVDGRKHALLSNATANVFLFFKPGQEHSRAVLQQVAVCARDLSTQSVHWVAVVSSRFSRTEIDAEVRETGIRMPVLIDDGDALYGRLGVALVPVTGITDRDHRLVAYQPFTKINYVEVVRARIRHLLKEISDAELAQVLNPPKATQGGDVEVALSWPRNCGERGTPRPRRRTCARVSRRIPRLLPHMRCWARSSRPKAGGPTRWMPSNRRSNWIRLTRWREKRWRLTSRACA